LIVSTPDVLSLRGVHRLTELWDRLGIRAEGSTRVVLNRVSRRNDLSPDAAAKIVRQPVLEAVLADDPTSLEASVNRRDPALVSTAWSKGLHAVSQELGTVPAPTLSATPRSRRLSRKKTPTAAETPESPAAAEGPESLPGPPEAAEHPTDRSGRPRPTAEDRRQDLGPRRLSRARSERGAVTVETLAVVGLFGAIA